PRTKNDPRTDATRLATSILAHGYLECFHPGFRTRFRSWRRGVCILDLVQHLRIKHATSAFRSNRRRWHHVAGKFIRIQGWIKKAVVITVIAAVRTTISPAKQSIDRTTPVGLAHSGQIPARVV